MGFDIVRERKRTFKDINRAIAHIGTLTLVIFLCSFFFSILNNIDAINFKPSLFKNTDTPPKDLNFAEIVMKWTLYSIAMLAPAFITTYYCRYFLEKRKIWKGKSYVELKKPSKERPWLIYICVSSIAYIISVLFFYFANQLDEKNILSPWEYGSWPIITASLTFFTCYRFDSLPKMSFANLSNSPKLWSAILQGTALAILSLLIMTMIKNNVGGKFSHFDDFILIITTNFLVGFMNSWKMPYYNAEMRTSKRFAQNVEPIDVKVIQQGTSCNAEILDISDRGMKLQLKSDMVLPSGENVEFCYQIDDIKYRFKGKVVSSDNQFIRVKMTIKENWLEVLQYLKSIFTTPIPAT